MKTLKDIVKEIENQRPRIQCNCDLDNWQPQTDTGHSCVCRIDNMARERFRNYK